jgi:hypothetical protein
MPRKQRTKEEAEKVKEKPSISQEEKNSLDQMLEGDEKEIDVSEIRELLNPEQKERTSPSLKKINAPQRTPTRLEGNLIAEGPVTNNNSKDEDDAFKYIPGKGKAGEVKYIKYEGAIVENIVQKREIETIPDRPFQRREVGFESSIQSRTPEPATFEKYSPIKRVEKEELGKERPGSFGKKDIKYTPEKY